MSGLLGKRSKSGRKSAKLFGKEGNERGKGTNEVSSVSLRELDGSEEGSDL